MGLGMALVKKDAVVQLRVSADLLETYRWVCETRHKMTVSQDLRKFMEWRVDEARKAGVLPVVEHDSLSVPAEVSSSRQKSPAEPEKLTRQQRPQMERESKKDPRRWDESY